VNWSLVFDVASDLVNVQVGVVLEVLWQAVVLFNDRVKDGGEVLVGVLITGVDTAVLVIELDGASDGLGKGESGGLGLDVSELFPLLRGQVLGNQALGGADGGEWGSGSLVKNKLVKSYEAAKFKLVDYKISLTLSSLGSHFQQTGGTRMQ